MQKSYYHFHSRGPNANFQATEFDGKRLRKAIARKTVDYNTSIVRALENRLFIKDYRDRRAFQPDVGYYPQLLPPMAMLDNPMNCVTSKFVRISTNKVRCPIFCVLWTPEGRRLVTGASSGEFTLWNGLTFNFETILQAHDAAVRVMVWSHNDAWMVTGDHAGYVKYWQSNMNNVKMFQAHKEPVRALSFCPTDSKLATCSDDGTVRVFDFFTCHEERILRGHGADVKCLQWHPTKSLVASGSKDNQQPIKLWDPRTGNSLTTIHAHKNTVMDLKWNQNGNWLLTASRDHLIKIFDIRNLGQEMQLFRGHKKEACCLAWHPVHEGLFASGGSDGSILFWEAGTEKEIGCMEQAHDSVIWALDWHPLGHILASGSNDHTCKFWTRNRPGDKMRDKYNLNTNPKGQEENDYDETAGDYEDMDEGGALASIPGLGMTDEFANEMDHQKDAQISSSILNHQPSMNSGNGPIHHRKVPFSKPVPKQFENQWSENRLPPPSSSSSHHQINSDDKQTNHYHHQNYHQQHHHQGQMLHPPPHPSLNQPPPPFSMHNGPPPPLPPPPPHHIAQQMGLAYGQMDPNMMSQMRPPHPSSLHSNYSMMSSSQQPQTGSKAPDMPPAGVSSSQPRLPNPNNFGPPLPPPPDFNQNPYTRGPPPSQMYPPFPPGQPFHQMPHPNYAPPHGGGEMRYRGPSGPNADRRFKKRRV